MKNIYQEYLHVPKDKHMSTKVFMTNLILSIVSILGCTFAMFATSYAWFSADVTSVNNTVASTFFEVHAEETSETVMLLSENTYETDLAAYDEHLFKLTSEGATTGYCIVTIRYEEDDYEEQFYTNQIPQDGYLMLGIQAAKGAQITFDPYWGLPEYHDWEGDCFGETVLARVFTMRRARVSAGEYIPGPATPYLEYQFPQYATLEDVAEFYEISLEDILIFNDIENPEEIEIGDWINLPYVDEDAEIYVALPPDIEHEVQEGETVESIAELYDISIEELIAYNGLEPYEEGETLAGDENANTEGESGEEMPMEEELEPVYVLTPGDILLIPYYAETGFTNPNTVREEDFIGKEPGYFEEEEPVDEPVDETNYEPWYGPVDEEETPETSDWQDSEEEETSEQPEIPEGVLVNGDISETEPEEPEQTEQPEENTSGVLQLG